MALKRSPPGGLVWPKSTGPCPPFCSPDSLAPQQTTSPFARSAQAWKSPLLTATNCAPGSGLGAAVVDTGSDGGARDSACAVTRSESATVSAITSAVRPTPERSLRCRRCVMKSSRLRALGMRCSLSRDYATGAQSVPSEFLSDRNSSSHSVQAEGALGRSRPGGSRPLARATGRHPATRGHLA